MRELVAGGDRLHAQLAEEFLVVMSAAAADKQHRALSLTAGPVLLLRGGYRRVLLANDPFNLFGEGAVLLGEVIGQQEYIAAPLSQGGQLNGKDVDAVVEMLPELAGLDGFLQIAIRGRDDPHVNGSRCVAADALEFALLQDAEQFHLQGRRELADFVPEQGSALRRFQPSDAFAGRPRKRAPFVPEQLALQQMFVQRGAVDFDKGTLGAVAREMNGRRDQLLPRAGLATDDHGRVVRSHLADAQVHAAHFTRVADDVFGTKSFLKRIAQLQVLCPQGLLFGMLDPPRAHVITDHAGNDRQAPLDLLQAHDIACRRVDGQRSHRLTVQQDGHAHESRVFCLSRSPRVDAVAKPRLGGNARHRDRRAVGKDLTGDPFAGAISGGVHHARGIRHSRRDMQLLAVRRQQHDRAADQTQMLVEYPENLLQSLVLTATAGQ